MTKQKNKTVVVSVTGIMSMTGEIRKILDSSDAVDSLRMESYIASRFMSRGWPAYQGVYYIDPSTNKSREIDVICRHYIGSKKPNDFNGSPLINFSIICECKSLSGWNVVVSPVAQEIFPYRLKDHWCGFGDYAWKVVETIAKEQAFPRINKNRVYSYFTDRAHPDHTQLNFPLALSPPPVDLVATAFRSSKSGKFEHDKIDPIWSAIQSTFSSMAAAIDRSAKTTDAWFTNFRHHVSSQRKYAEDIATMYDIELARRVLFHPIVFTRSRIYNERDGMDEINSVRLVIKNLDFESQFVDIVQLDKSASYIDSMIDHFEKHSRSAIRRTLTRYRALGWSPGQESRGLGRALGLSSPRSLVQNAKNA